MIINKLILKFKFNYNSLILLVVVLGDASVGKTSLIRRIFNKNFENNIRTTIGIEFATLEVNDKVNKKNIYVQFWDTCKLIN